MRLATVHPGVTEEEVRGSTGFELPPEPPASETPAPTEEELAALRRVDPEAVLG